VEVFIDKDKNVKTFLPDKEMAKIRMDLSEKEQYFSPVLLVRFPADFADWRRNNQC